MRAEVLVSELRRSWRRVGAALLAVALSGGAACRAALDRVFTRPAVTFAGVSMTGMGIGGGSLEILLRVANPNPYSLSATQATYRLLVGDSSEVGHGAVAQPFSVGARDSTVVRLPLDVSWSGLRQAGRRAVDSGAIDYRVVGQITASTLLGAYEIPFDERGRFAGVRMLGR